MAHPQVGQEHGADREAGGAGVDRPFSSAVFARYQSGRDAMAAGEKTVPFKLRDGRASLDYQGHHEEIFQMTKVCQVLLNSSKSQ